MKDIQGKSQRTTIPTLVDSVDGSPRETAHEKAEPGPEGRTLFQTRLP